MSDTIPGPERYGIATDTRDMLNHEIALSRLPEAPDLSSLQLEFLATPSAIDSYATQVDPEHGAAWQEARRLAVTAITEGGRVVLQRTLIDEHAAGSEDFAAAVGALFGGFEAELQAVRSANRSEWVRMFAAYTVRKVLA